MSVVFPLMWHPETGASIPDLQPFVEIHCPASTQARALEGNSARQFALTFTRYKTTPCPSKFTSKQHSLTRDLHLSQSSATHYDTIILGAGAAGLMCAAEAARNGGKVLIIDHARSPGEKIRISGGGRCNFTNLETTSQRFLSRNKHFAKSALKRYTQFDFVDLVKRHNIPFHEKAHGALFCDTTAKDIIQLLLKEIAAVGAELWLQTSLKKVAVSEDGFSVRVERDGASRTLSATHFVVACGGKSIPKMGATGLGYQIAEQFGIDVTETLPALVPLRISDEINAWLAPLSGVSVDAVVSCGKTKFNEALLITHRGLSGPSILQISSYWREKLSITVALAPNTNITELLTNSRANEGNKSVGNILSSALPNRLATAIAEKVGNGRAAELSNKAIAAYNERINNWQLWPIGTEGYRTAEVTLGGVNTDELSSQSMAAKKIPNLYFIGEVVDVTGWLGGYNFQWAWSSGWAAGTAIAEQN
jgi:hypothetical protein